VDTRLDQTSDTLIPDDPDDPGVPSMVKAQWRGLWPMLRMLVGFALVVGAAWVVSQHRAELDGFSKVVSTLNWWWVPPAVVVELLSFVAFAGLQREFLVAGDLEAPWSPLTKLSFASQALANSFPGGNAFASVYGFRWYRRFGADSTLAVWALIGTFVASMVTLAAVAVIGLGLAAEEGASLDLVPVLIGALVVTVAMGVIFFYEPPLHWVVGQAIRGSRAVTGRPRGDTAETIQEIMRWVAAVRLSWRDVSWVLVWGSLNWLLDCACFAMMFEAVGAPIPWKGLLLAYGAGQLAATLPITPGGLGVVEGSITIALVAFGSPAASTTYAVLMYRFISFWLVLVVGWALIGELALEVRRGRWVRRALTCEVDAGPGAGAGAEALPDVSVGSAGSAGLAGPFGQPQPQPQPVPGVAT
jgi:putative heme transporter